MHRILFVLLSGALLLTLLPGCTSREATSSQIASAPEALSPADPFYGEVLEKLGAKTTEDGLLVATPCSLLTVNWAEPEELAGYRYTHWYLEQLPDLPREEKRDRYAPPKGETGWLIPAEELEQAAAERFGVSTDHLRADTDCYREDLGGYQTGGVGLGDRPVLTITAVHADGDREILTILEEWTVEQRSQTVELTIRRNGADWQAVSCLPAPLDKGDPHPSAPGQWLGPVGVLGSRSVYHGLSFQHFQQVVNFSNTNCGKKILLYQLYFHRMQKSLGTVTCPEGFFRLSGQDPQMLQQDLQADENQDHAAAQLRPGLEAAAEHTAHTHPHRRKHKGDGADQGSRPQDLPAGHAQKGKADPHRQGIDAGGHRQGQHRPEAEGGIQFLLLGAAAGFPDHAAADEAEQYKGNPVVDAGDRLGKAHPQQPADGRHQPLKAAEVEPGQQVVPEILFPAGEPLADGDGKGIHRKPYGNETQLDQTHLLLPLFCCPALLLLYEQAA